MSTFGGPGGRQVIAKPTPPERGSFPLDHDAECQHIMKSYLRCLRAHRGMNDDECRMLSKSYLQCRMDNNLMAPDEMKNLGYDNTPEALAASAAAAAGQSKMHDATKKGPERGQK
ncbi:CHCH domain-containing protein [Aureobasidium pullulans]|uniref:CHCH domain-containing protein n=1 Tax=Aureobasidium pullulans TaxID=5580 RepID=A0A4S8XKR2_AURPU|nr:CHCH domain-containing protein [Aureobasidium pullulans]THZ42195.1 CHCH domain-containing protein [Aureobasidium pullulans]